MLETPSACSVIHIYDPDSSNEWIQSLHETRVRFNWQSRVQNQPDVNCCGLTDYCRGCRPIRVQNDGTMKTLIHVRYYMA